MKRLSIFVSPLLAAALLFQTACTGTQVVSDIQKALQILEVLIPILQAGGFAIAPEAESYTQQAADALAQITAEDKSSDPAQTKRAVIVKLVESVVLPPIQTKVCGGAQTCSDWSKLQALDAAFKVILQDVGILGQTLTVPGTTQAEGFVARHKLASLHKRAVNDSSQIAKARARVLVIK